VKTPLSIATLIAALIAGCLLVATPGAAGAQTYYKWTDDEGTVHFTAEPPADRDYESIDTNGNVVASTRPEPSEPGQDSEAAAAAEPVLPREGEPDPELIEARCKQARENLFWLESKRRIVVEDDQGNERFIDAEEQQDLIEENRALIAEWCDGAGPPDG